MEKMQEYKNTLIKNTKQQLKKLEETNYRQLKKLEETNYRLDISLQILADYDQNDWNYQENFEEVYTDQSWGGKTIIFYTDYNQQTWKKIPLQELFTVNASKQQLRNELGYDNKSIPISELRENFLIEYDFKELCDHEWVQQNFELYASRGYCQGDYVEVLIPNKKTLDKYSMHIMPKSDIDNMLWETPFSYMLTINDDDFHIGEHFTDKLNEYEYNDKELKKAIKDFTDELVGKYSTDPNYVKQLNEFLGELPETYLDKESYWFEMSIMG